MSGHVLYFIGSIGDKFNSYFTCKFLLYLTDINNRRAEYVLGGINLFKAFYVMQIFKQSLNNLRLCVIATLFLMVVQSPLLADELSGEIGLGRLLNFATGLSTSSSSLGSLSKLANFNGGTSTGSDELIVSEVGFSSVNQSAVLSISDQVDTVADDETDPSVIGDALVFPNPFRQSSDIGAVLGYELSKDLDIEIRIYNMFAQQIVIVTFNAGAFGGRDGYNTVQLNRESLGGAELSAGVYFYLIMNDGDVLARGKMAVKP